MQHAFGMIFWKTHQTFLLQSPITLSVLLLGVVSTHLYHSRARLGLGINNDSMKEDIFRHIHEGRLYGIKMTGHVQWVLLIFPYGFNPSVANPSLTSNENTMYLESNNFQALKSVGCLSKSSFTWPLACHFIWLAISRGINSRCNLGFKGNHRRIFMGFFFFFLEEALVLCWPLAQSKS